MRAATRERPARRRGPGRPPGPSQAAQLRQRLIAEASALYAAGGPAGLSFATLAERTGLGKATVFHYFPSKEALIDAVFQSLGDRLAAAAAEWFNAAPHGHGVRLTRLVESLVDFYGADPLNARILCHGLLDAERHARPAAGDVPHVFASFVRRFVAFIEEGIAAGAFHRQRPMAAVMAVGGIILFEFMLPDAGRRLAGDVPLAQRRREMVALLQRALVR